MSSGSLFTVVMIYLAISTFLYLGGVRVVENDTESFLDNFIDIEKYANEGVLAPSSDLESTVPTSYTESGADTGLNFIDVITAIQGFLIFIANIIFSPLGLFIGSGLPPLIAMLLALPLLVAGVFGLISFVRGISG